MATGYRGRTLDCRITNRSEEVNHLKTGIGLSIAVLLAAGLIVLVAFWFVCVEKLHHCLSRNIFSFMKANPKRIRKAKFIVRDDERRHNCYFSVTFVVNEKIGVNAVIAVVPKHKSCPILARMQFLPLF